MFKGKGSGKLPTNPGFVSHNYFKGYFKIKLKIFLGDSQRVAQIGKSGRKVGKFEANKKLYRRAEKPA